jgi:predicted CoA-binding protein
VNPNETEVLGEKAYPTIADVPEPVEFVDVFRRPQFTPQIVDEAIAAGAKAVWLQQGIRNEEARRKAEAAGLLFVQDRCVLQEHRRMRSQGLA